MESVKEKASNQRAEDYFPTIDSRLKPRKNNAGTQIICLYSVKHEVHFSVFILENKFGKSIN